MSTGTHILFRTDGNGGIGLGHVMRCLTIADALKEMHAMASFVTSDRIPEALITSRGYSCRVLDNDFRKKDEADARETVSVADEAGASLVFVDSYAADDPYLLALGKKKHVALISNLPKTFPADLLINDNLACDTDGMRALYQGTQTVLLLGSSYAPIRKEFLEASCTVEPVVRTVLITTGGGDQTGFMPAFLTHALKHPLCKNLHYICVSGFCNTHRDRLVSLAGMYPQLEILEDVRDMASLMERADLAISAGGTTVLELAVVGVPTIAFSSAPDQVPGLLYMQREGMCRYAGQAADEGFMDRMFYHFDELLTDDRLRLRLHTEARRHLDGNGAARIAGALIRAGGGA